MGYEKIGTLWNEMMRNAIDSMFQELFNEYRYAGVNAKDARDMAEKALIAATESKELSEKTREEMTAIIREQTQNGDLAPEIAQSRGDFSTLGERLDSSDSQIEQFESDIKPLVEGIRSSTAGDVRMTTVMKDDDEVLPYFINEDLLGDTSEEAVNKLYEEMDTNDIYDLYDRLVNKDTELRKGYTWDTMDDGTPLRWYHFEPDMRRMIPNSSTTGEPRFDVYGRLLASKPVLFITSGVHGNEKTNIWALYLTLRDILDGKTELDRHIRRNYEIVVLPACNPYGLKHNTRRNENDVDVNRNFPYKWEGDTSSSKGLKPYSEISARFIRDVRDSFLEGDLSTKQGMLFVDSHDFNYNNYSNNRILWVGANDRQLRKTLINVGGMVYEKLTDMYPDLITGESQNFFNLGATGVGYGSTINAWNWDSRVSGFSLECVNDLTVLGVERKYSIQSSRIGYYVVRDFITQTTLEHSGRTPDSTIVGFRNALSNEDDGFLETLHSIPSGRTLIAGVYSRDSKFSEHMPLDPKGRTYKGIFKATKSDGSKTSSGFMEFTTTTYKYVRRFYGSFNGSGFSDWYEIGRGVLDTTYGSMGLSSSSATILDVFNAMGNNQVRVLYVTPSTEGMHSQLSNDSPVQYGTVKIVRNTSKTGSVEHTTYSQSRNRRFFTSISQGELTEWTEMLTREEKIKLSFEELDLHDETATIIDVFNRLEEGQIAKLYVTGKTDGIHSQLPNAVNVSFGSIEIVKNTDITGNVEHFNYSRSRNRRFCTSISQGKLTSWTEILTESVD